MRSALSDETTQLTWLVFLPPPVDPEMRAEFEERQKTNPMNSILSGAAPGTGPGGFDLAAMLAGSGKKESGNGGGSKK